MDKFAGTVADVGCYSLNYHKHIHTGEGGILVTDDDELAKRMRLICNHAEAVAGDMGEVNLANMIGYNFRLEEIECAIGIEQLKKLARFVAEKQRVAERLNNGLRGLPGLRTPIVMPNCTHAYYVYPMLLDTEKLGTSCARIAEALEAEGVAGIASGYTNFHLLPMYQKKMAFGSSGFPWSSDICHREVNYRNGICPTAEALHNNNFLQFAMCMKDLSDGDVDLVVAAFKKVLANLPCHAGNE